MTTLTTRPEESTANLLKAVTLISVIGALNWGLIGLFNWNLVDAIFGGGTAETTSTGSRIVYALVGLAGLLTLFLLASRRVLLAPRQHHHST
jgi:uncharacterized membrane protein YuzA (DUF378 family)